MTKVEIAHQRILDILAESQHGWVLSSLLTEVNYALELENMVSLSTLRKAVALLPESCVITDGGRITVTARGFAKPAEVIAAIKSLEHWCDDLPVLIERHKPTLRRALALENDWALIQSIEWASYGVFTIEHGYYGTSVRWVAREAA